MGYQLEGKVKLVNETQTFSSGFSKREIVVSVPDGNYTQDICIEFVKDKTDLLDNVKSGDQVSINFDIKGREYSGKYYNNLQGWKLDNISHSSADNQRASSTSNPDPLDIDGIPF